MATSAPLADGRAVGGVSLLVGEEPAPRLFLTLKAIAQIAAPNVVGYLMTFVNELTNTVVIGQAGDQATLAAIGLANMMQNCFGLSIGLGIANALDTLISQAHGARQPELACQHLQRCRMLCTLQLVWIIPVLWFSEEWLTLIHQDLDVAKHAGAYNRASVWGLFACFQSEANRKFMQNRGCVNPPAIILSVAAVLHVAWCCFFVAYLRLGNAGAGYANAVTWSTQFLLTSVYLYFTSRREGLRTRSVLWIERPGLREWGPYLRLAIPSTVQLCTEWWFWELCAIVVGYLGKVALAAHVATLNWVAVSFMPAIGISASTSTLVGNALGANEPRKARYTTFCCVGVNLATWTVIATGTAVARSLIARAYSADAEIQELMEKLLCIFAVVGFFDSSQNVMGGALRGIGRQSLAAVTYIVSFYGVMAPGACVAAFSLHMGVFGVWYSMLLGTGLAAVVFNVSLMRTDFRRVAAEASARMEREGHEAKKTQEAAEAARTAQHSDVRGLGA